MQVSGDNDGMKELKKKGEPASGWAGADNADQADLKDKNKNEKFKVIKKGMKECPRPTRFFFNLVGLREG